MIGARSRVVIRYRSSVDADESFTAEDAESAEVLDFSASAALSAVILKAGSERDNEGRGR